MVQILCFVYQLDVYKEDFKLEQEDKEKIQSEKASLQERIQKYEHLVHSLNKEVCSIYFNKEAFNAIEPNESVLN